jgi:transcription-repair coupling factor (superfamily II helicase)
MNERQLQRRAPLPPEVSSSSPLGAIAVLLLSAWREWGPGGLMFVSASEQKAEQLGAMLHGLDPECGPMVLPRSDASPYDGAMVSREIAGRRASVLRRLAEQTRTPLLLTSAEAALQRVPGLAAWSDATLTLRPGMAIDEAALRRFLERSGYELDSRVDAPGEAAIEGQVVDIFPAGAIGPVRMTHAGGRITGLSAYDPATQRTSVELLEVTVDPASEMIALANSPADPAAPARFSASLFEYIENAALLLDSGVSDRVEDWLAQIADAYETSRERPEWARATNAATEPPSTFYLSEQEWRAALTRHHALAWPAASSIDLRIPKFAAERAPTTAFRRFIEEQRTAGRRVVLAAGDNGDRGVLERRACQAGSPAIVPVASWSEAEQQPPGSLCSLVVDLDQGFLLPSREIVAVAAADLLGSRTVHDAPLGWRELARSGAVETLTPGDVVIHVDRGVGLLRGLDTIEAEPATDVVRLEFAGGVTVMLPVEELAFVWKYGSQRHNIQLDRADGSSWEKRRAELALDINETVAKLVAFTEARRAKRGPKLTPPSAAYERFVARFPYTLTPDQASATADVLADLASGGLMDRLICGDVGFGKTEVALRAAATVLLSGKQVAVVAPTTLLARQHFETFRRRFSGFGVSMALLSRSGTPAERRAAKTNLGDGTIQLVIGTHAIAGKGVRFKELGLVIVDEEQHFGTRDKERLRALASDVHVLTLSATPIPRTMQLALAGVRDLSVIATAPLRRRPVETAVAMLSETTIRAALRYEKHRGGQSFVVCPRIEDLEPWQTRLQAIVPELRRHVIHGKMPGSAIDDTMMRFAAGDGDILLATNIVESGLDLPRANTIIIWHPERFGLAQLHQLRGRVGRGNQHGYAYLITEDAVKLTKATRARLEMLQQFASLGAGFRIGESDLDLRGGGDLFGENQAGHLSLVGAPLYRYLFERAMRLTRGEKIEADYVPELHIAVANRIPPSYIASDERRLEIYYRAAHARDDEDIDRLIDEIEDRFGAIPLELERFFQLARLRVAAARLGIGRLDAGPDGVAMVFRRLPQTAAIERQLQEAGLSCHWSDERLIVERASEEDQRIALALKILSKLDTVRSRRASSKNSPTNPQMGASISKAH